MSPTQAPVALTAAQARVFLAALYSLVLGRTAVRNLGMTPIDLDRANDIDIIRMASALRLEIQRMYPTLY